MNPHVSVHSLSSRKLENPKIYTMKNWFRQRQLRSETILGPSAPSSKQPRCLHRPESRSTTTLSILFLVTVLFLGLHPQRKEPRYFVAILWASALYSLTISSKCMCSGCSCGSTSQLLCVTTEKGEQKLVLEILMLQTPHGLILVEVSAVYVPFPFSGISVDKR